VQIERSYLVAPRRPSAVGRYLCRLIDRARHPITRQVLQSGQLALKWVFRDFLRRYFRLVGHVGDEIGQSTMSTAAIGWRASFSIASSVTMITAAAWPRNAQSRGSAKSLLSPGTARRRACRLLSVLRNH